MLEGYKTDVLTDTKYGRRMASQEKSHKERDARMSF